MDPEIKDLIQKLLVKDPQQRLGAGSKGFLFSLSLKPLTSIPRIIE